jgi:hypothetical protein
VLEPGVTGQEDGLHTREVPVHQGHGELVGEVGATPQSLDDRLRLHLAADVHEQPVLEELDLDVRKVGTAVHQEVAPLLGREGPTLAGVVQDGDDNLVVERCRTFDDIGVAERDGVVGAWAHTPSGHATTLAAGRQLPRTRAAATAPPAP